MVQVSEKMFLLRRELLKFVAGNKKFCNSLGPNGEERGSLRDPNAVPADVFLGNSDTRESASQGEFIAPVLASIKRLDFKLIPRQKLVIKLKAILE